MSAQSVIFDGKTMKTAIGENETKLVRNQISPFDFAEAATLLSSSQQ